MTPGAVITADIVNSTRLAKADLKKIMKSLGIILAGYKHEFFRGDSFQVYLKSPADAYRIVLLARVSCIKLSSGISDVKASIGIDEVQQPVRDLKKATGPAFVISGRQLDALKPDRRLEIACNEKNAAINTGLRVIARFTDYLFGKMTPKQAAVVFELLMKNNQVETAKKLKKSQATIHKHIQSAGWPDLEALISEYDLLTQSIPN